MEIFSTLFCCRNHRTSPVWFLARSHCQHKIHVRCSAQFNTLFLRNRIICKQNAAWMWSLSWLLYTWHSSPFPPWLAEIPAPQPTSAFSTCNTQSYTHSFLNFYLFAWTVQYLSRIDRIHWDSYSSRLPFWRLQITFFLYSIFEETQLSGGFLAQLVVGLIRWQTYTWVIQWGP